MQSAEISSQGGNLNAQLIHRRNPMNHTIERSSTHSIMHACIDACQHCHHMCLQIAMNHCLEAGGKNVEAKHFRLMMNCAEICQTSLNFMLTNSPFAGSVCKVCAEICEICAVSCEKIGGMEDCVEACRECAESCYEMTSAQY